MNSIRIFTVLLAITLVACGGSTENQTGELPNNATELKAMKDALTNTMRQTEQELERVTAKLEKLEPPKKGSARLVTIEDVTRGDFNRFAQIQGSVQSKDLVSVSTEVPGRLTQVTVAEGDPVNKGQLIASIDMESMQKQRLEVEKQLELSRDIYERQKRLWDQEIGSEVQYLQAKNSVERLEQSLETLDYSLTKSNIYAPITGVVDMDNLKVGEMAQPGMPIVTILNTKNFKVVADVSENYLGKVSRGQLVEVYFPALGTTTEAPVTMIGRKIDAANRTFKIEVDLRAPDGLIKPNLLAQVLINDYTEEDVIVISQELVQQEVGGRIYVMLVDDRGGDMYAKKSYITTGESYEGDVVVVTGIEPGDRLVVSGSRGLSNDEPIKIMNPEIASDDK